MRGFFVTTVNYIRLVVLMAGEIVKELYQAERQRGWSVEPRMHRGLHFAVERAATNIALRTVSTALVIEEMYGAAPTIYVDYTGYDAISHHCGPERVESIDALEGIDRAIGSLLKAATYTARAYRMVVLSDHGQCLGASFRQRYGESIEAVIAAFLPGEMTVTGTTGSVESAGMGGRIAAEFGRGRGLAPRVARGLPSGRRRQGGGAVNTVAPPAPDVVVASSGNLAHVYFTGQLGRVSGETLEARYPGLIEGLVCRPGIGALIVRSAAGHALVHGARGRLDLATGQLDGADPLADYGSRAGDALRRLEGFATAGDIILLGAVDNVSGEVTGFEDLIGSHGGLGGWQTEPFILCPSGFTLEEDPPVGAPALYRQLIAWRTQLQQEPANGQPSPPAATSSMTGASPQAVAAP
jgi:Type I phosphodiesterase / nucleotide pyrophosphatase